MLFTVLTPTFNRADLLPRTYESLKRQFREESDQLEEFEWLIIDDGSTDNTEALVKEWQPHAGFPVRYERQINQGKHIALNLGAQRARGELLVILDSDDWLTENSLAATRSLWESIPPAERSLFAGVVGRCLYPSGDPYTRPFPQDPLDSRAIEIETRHGISGELIMVPRTDVLRAFPFPDHLGKFCMESLVWNRIAHHYITRYSNVALQYKEYQNQGLTLSGFHRRLRQSPEAYRLRSHELLASNKLYLPGKHRARAMRMWIRASLHAGRSFVAQWNEKGFSFLWLSQCLKAWRDYRRDLYRLAKEDRQTKLDAHAGQTSDKEGAE